MKRLFWAPVVCLALGAWAGVGQAAPPVEADPAKDYVITPEAGPWMILAASFTGPKAPELAKQLVYQIRSRDHYPAYVFNYADEERRKQREELERQHIVSADNPGRIRTIHVEESCAVLVGGYRDADAAHAALVAFKKLPAPDLKAPDGYMPFPTAVQPVDLGNGRAQAKIVMINPFAIAFAVPNPTVPHDVRPADRMNDPFLEKLNDGEDYSLLKCPGRYTLAIKEYFGFAVVQQQAETSPFLKLIGLGGPKTGESSLGVAAVNAHELAKTLQQLKFDAYVLHTRTSSVVTIGGFQDENDPNVARVCQQIQSLRKEVAAAQKSGSKDPLGLFAMPVLMPVPKLR
jgi:hypothetical protein